MKYLILTSASQVDYDGMAGKPTAGPGWSAEDFGKMGAFMGSFLAFAIDPDGPVARVFAITGITGKHACHSTVADAIATLR